MKPVAEAGTVPPSAEHRVLPSDAQPLSSHGLPPLPLIELFSLRGSSHCTTAVCRTAGHSKCEPTVRTNRTAQDWDRVAPPSSSTRISYLPGTIAAMTATSSLALLPQGIDLD